jgi:hypothetical protein
MANDDCGIESNSIAFVEKNHSLKRKKRAISELEALKLKLY